MQPISISDKSAYYNMKTYILPRNVVWEHMNMFDVIMSTTTVS